MSKLNKSHFLEDGADKTENFPINNSFTEGSNAIGSRASNYMLQSKPLKRNKIYVPPLPFIPGQRGNIIVKEKKLDGPAQDVAFLPLRPASPPTGQLGTYEEDSFIREKIAKVNLKRTQTPNPELPPPEKIDRTK